MRHASNEKQPTICERRNGTTKSRKIRTLTEKQTYKYLGILEADTIKQEEIKEKIKKEYLRRTRKLLKNKLNSSNHLKVKNTWTFPLLIYS